MAKFCLTKDQTNKFLRGLRLGEIDPLKMSKMTSSERRQYLANFVGKDNAVQVNSLFESKLLLKNQKAGYISWAKKVSGISPEAKRDMIARIERLDNVLDSADEKAFLEDLASTKLGFNVSQSEAKKIFELSKTVRDKRATWEAKWGNKDWTKDKSWWNDSDRLEYGASQIALQNFTSDLKNLATKQGLKSYASPGKAITELAGITKVLKATLDVSYIFRQGWRTLWSNPISWQRNVRKSLVDYLKTVKNKDQVMDAINADIISRPYYDKMVKSKLAIHIIEEAFPTRLPQKIPLFGRLVKASDTAFTGFAYRQRADIFEANLKLAKKVGVNIDDEKQLKAIAKMVNAMTGRGHLGVAEGLGTSNIINNVFFAPRWVASQVQAFTHPITGAGGSNFVRVQATHNLLRVIAGTAGVLMMARGVLGKDAIELDPRSSDFGQIKIGNTRFDVSGGHRTLITLASRLITQKTKSTTGVVNDLNSGDFGSRTGVDVAFDFAQNKLSPVGQVVRDLIRQEDFDGNRPTVAGIANNLFVPLPIVNAKELKDDPNSAPLLLGLMAESTGIGTNTYGKDKTDWNQSTGKELTQFKEKVGEDKFKQANEKYSKRYDEWFQKTIRDPRYQNLSDEDKKDLLSKAKEDIKSDIFKSYRFKYKTEKKSRKQKQVVNRLLPK